MPKEKNMGKWEIITPDLTDEYIRSEYRREIIETGGTRCQT
jgi:hypothetical protein